MSSSDLDLNVEDCKWISRAVRLARKGQYTASPNPCVACLIVKEGVLLSEGFHKKSGEPHAEINALNQLSSIQLAEGSTVYVTLEPCSHQGKTPPCVEALLSAKVKRVVVAMQDPNPLVSGQGIQKLRAAGVDVSVGLLADEAQQINRGFVKRMQDKTPFVYLKSAMSFDGRTAMASGESKWITGAPARLDVQKLRASCDAIVTGIGTVIADDPSITVRDLGETPISRQPMRVVLDTGLRIDPKAKVLARAQQEKVVVFCCTDEENKKQTLEDKGVTVVVLLGKKINLKEVLSYLADNEVNTVLVEAGAKLSASFVQQNLVDEMIIYVAPKILGAQARPLFDLKLTTMQEAHKFEVKQVRMLGDDIRYTLS